MFDTGSHSCLLVLSFLLELNLLIISIFLLSYYNFLLHSLVSTEKNVLIRTIRFHNLDDIQSNFPIQQGKFKEHQVNLESGWHSPGAYKIFQGLYLVNHVVMLHSSWSNWHSICFLPESSRIFLA